MPQTRTSYADPSPENATARRPRDDVGAMPISVEVVRVGIGRLRMAESPRLNGVDPDHVRTLMELDEPLPPIIVHRSTMRVIDGMHRLEAARRKGRVEIDVRYFSGDRSDAFRLAVQTNTAHGLPLSREDRKAAAARILRSHPHLSDRAIAHTTGLAAKTVARIRRQNYVHETHRRIGRDGRVRPLSTADGRRIAVRAIAARPEASLREIAQEAGISVGTVRAVRACLDAGRDPVPTRQAHRHADRDMAVPGNDIPESVDINEVMDGLLRDPSLRYTDRGRTLLRCLNAHVTLITRLGTMVEGVPPHCATLVAKVARKCANSWSFFATTLDERGGGYA